MSSVLMVRNVEMYKEIDVPEVYNRFFCGNETASDSETVDLEYDTNEEVHCPSGIRYGVE